MRSNIAVVPLGCMVGLMGCVSISNFKSARALAPGTYEVDVAASASGTSPQTGANAYARGTNNGEVSPSTPTFEVQARGGVVPGFDLGGKLSLANAELNGTIQLLHRPSLDLALAPAAGVAASTNGDDESWTELTAKLPLLIGIRFGPSREHQIVLGVAAMGVTGSAQDKNADKGFDPRALLAGASIGVSFALGAHLHLMPEIAAYTPIVGSAIGLTGGNVRVSPDVHFGSPVLVQAGMAFGFGSAQPEP